jgi:hypothetical protein
VKGEDLRAGDEIDGRKVYWAMKNRDARRVFIKFNDRGGNRMFRYDEEVTVTR